MYFEKFICYLNKVSNLLHQSFETWMIPSLQNLRINKDTGIEKSETGNSIANTNIYIYIVVLVVVAVVVVVVVVVYIYVYIYVCVYIYIYIYIYI